LEKVVDKSNIPAGTLVQHLGGIDRDGKPFAGFPLYQGYIGGVLVEQSFNQSAVITALAGSPLETHHYIQHPTGRRELFAYRPVRSGYLPAVEKPTKTPAEKFNAFVGVEAVVDSPTVRKIPSVAKAEPKSETENRVWGPAMETATEHAAKVRKITADFF
jgi:hypothetical protein